MRSVGLKYADLYIKGSQRARRNPRVSRPWRTKKLLNLTAFFRNRFYNIDRWYKARIEKPIVYPKMYTIDPAKFTRSLQQRLLDEHPRSLSTVNIGFSWKNPGPAVVDAAPLSADQLADLELKARKQQLLVNLDDVESNSTRESEPQRIKLIAEHFGIYRDLFDQFSYFYPVLPLRVAFAGCLPDSSDILRTVHFGNIVMPAEAQTMPEVWYPANDNSLWTLLLTNPDGNVYETNKEVLHWLLVNIRGSRIADGQCLCPYIQPLPWRGTGLHRLVFVLFKQKNELPHPATVCPTVDSKTLPGRTFSTYDFYRQFEDSLTPAGLAFFQSQWDASCSKCVRHKFDMKEPLYSYDWPAPYIPAQQVIPEEPQPFNEYLDKYRDVQDIEAELLLKRLSRMTINTGGPTKLKYPNIFYEQEKEALPSWVHMEKYKENLGVGKYRAIYENPLD